MNGQDLTNGGVIFLTEQADAEADIEGKGQIWVKTVTPNQLWFTTDSGLDIQLSSGGEHVNFWDIDGTPTAVYTKILTGNLTTGDGMETIAHSISGDDKIIAVSCILESDAVGNFYHCFSNADIASTARSFLVQFDSTNVYIKNRGTDIDTTNRYVIKIDYIL